MKEKESIEKSRINQRGSSSIPQSLTLSKTVGYEAKHLYVKELLHFSDPTSDLYLPGCPSLPSLTIPIPNPNASQENERFDKDFASYDKKVREQKFLSKEMINEKHRIEALEREAQKWEKIEKEAEKELIKKDYHRQVLQAGKRNMNGSPFNPITLEYENSNKGLELKKRDEDAKVMPFS